MPRLRINLKGALRKCGALLHSQQSDSASLISPIKYGRRIEAASVILYHQLEQRIAKFKLEVHVLRVRMMRDVVDRLLRNAEQGDL